MSYAVAVILATLVGFLAGLLAFKVKTRWCPRCGEWTLERPAHRVEHRRVRQMPDAAEVGRLVDRP